MKAYRDEHSKVEAYKGLLSVIENSGETIKILKETLNAPTKSQGIS